MVSITFNKKLSVHLLQDLRFVIFLLLIIITVSCCFCESPQERYPWGHQLLHLYTDLIPAEEPPARVGAFAGFGGMYEDSIPLSSPAKGRKLFKVPLSFFVYFPPHIMIDGVWDILYHNSGKKSGFQGDPGDLRIYTTVFIRYDPGIAIRFGTKLANARNDFDQKEVSQGGQLSGAGTDQNDFHFMICYSHPIKQIGIHANAGFLILGAPTDIAAQNDVFNFSVGFSLKFNTIKPLLEYDFTAGPRRFDNFSALKLTIQYLRKQFYGKIYLSSGLNNSTDNLHGGCMLGWIAVKKRKPISAYYVR